MAYREMALSALRAEQRWNSHGLAGAQRQDVAMDNSAGSGSPGSCQPGTLCLASTHSTGVASLFTKVLVTLGTGSSPACGKIL